MSEYESQTIPVRIEFLEIWQGGWFRIYIDGKLFGNFTFMKGFDLKTNLSPGKHTLSTKIWPYWLWIGNKDLLFEIGNEISEIGFRLSYSRLWGKFSELSVTNIVSSGKEISSGKETQERDNKMILPHSLTPSDTISEWKTQGFPSEQKENVIESEKVPDVEAGSTMGKLEKLIERRNVGEVTSEEFEEMKKEILERKPQVSKDPVEIAQEEAQGDYVDDRDTIEEEKVMLKEKEVTKEVPAVASPVFMEQLDQLQGTKNARLLMGDKVAAEVSISGLQEVLESRKDNGVNTLVMDGIITQRLIELVPKAGINIIVAEKKGPLSRDPVGITMFTREDLVKGSVVSKSNIGAGGKSKSEELREAKALLDEGLINEDDYEKMKKDILGK